MCVEPYCGQDRDVPDTKPAVAKKTKAPRKRGFNRGLLRGWGLGAGGWGLREAHCHRNNVGATTPFPSKIEAARVRGVPAIPRRSPRTPLSPVPTGRFSLSASKMAERGTTGLIHMKARLRGLLALVAALAAAEAVVVAAWAWEV
jgi:hypothetical protein